MATQEIVRLGKLEISLDTLAQFLVKAKKSCYAGNGQEERLRDGSKVLTYQEGDFHYTDNYAGFYQAPGTEIVRWQKPDGQRLWQMSYSGGMIPRFQGDKDSAKKTFEFLKLALSKVSQHKPFRGPEDRVFTIEFGPEYYNWEYTAETEGDLIRFKGKEEIRVIGYIYDKLFSQDYIGGLVIPKD